MGFIFTLISLLPAIISAAPARLGVRTVSASSCDITRINLSLGMTTQINFEDNPTLSLHADQKHFLVKTSESAKKVIALIPQISEEEITQLRAAFPGEAWVGEKSLSIALDKAYQTNLFVYFKNSSLMFSLRFVDKSEADYIVYIKQRFNGKCPL